MQVQTVFGTTKSVDEALQAVEAALTERKFSVLWHLHVNQKLQEKGLSLAPEVHILEVCSAPRAKEAIEMNLEVSTFLPCKITVRANQGKTEVVLLRPTAIMALMDDPRLVPLAEEVEGVLKSAIEAAVATA